MTTLPFPFPVTLYGQSFTEARISSNGALEFGSAVSDYNNMCLPYGPYTYTIIPHWDDMRTDQVGSGVFTAVYGSAPSRVFVVEWRARYYGDSTKRANFEVLFYEDRPAFEVIYGAIEQGGLSATVGVQQNGTNFTLYSCNQAKLAAGHRLLFGGLEPAVADDAVRVGVNSNPVTIDVLANDVDLNGYGLRIASATAAANGFVAVAADGASVSYTPVAEFLGSDSFTYTVVNVFGRTATATVTVEVENHAPTARDDTASTPEDAPITISVIQNDDSAPDPNETLRVISAAGASHGTLAYAPGSVTYSPAPNYYGADSFTYTISDGHGGIASARVQVTVAPVNDDPTALNDVAEVDQRSSVAIDVLANDTIAPDAAEALSITAIGAPANGTVQASANGIIYTPAQTFYGTDSFTYTISDGNGGSASASVTVTVRKVNTPPQVVLASPAALQLSEGDRFTLAGTIIDPDPVDAHTVAINWGDGSPASTIELTGGQRDFSANHVFVDNPPAGSNFELITVSVIDSHGETAVASQRVTVANVAPVITGFSELPPVIVVGTTVLLQTDFSDPGLADTHEVRFVWGDGTADTVATSGGYSRSASHTYSLPGIYSYRVVVTDKDGGSVSSTLRQVVTVDPTGGFLTGGGWIQVQTGSASYGIAAGAKLTFSCDAAYQAGGALQGQLSFTVGGLNFASTSVSWLVASGRTGVLAGKGTVNGAGEFIFRFATVDGEVAVVPDTIQLQVWDAATGALVFETAGVLGGGNTKLHASTTKSAQASPSKLAR